MEGTEEGSAAADVCVRQNAFWCSWRIMMDNHILDVHQLRAICDVLGDTTRGPSKAELTSYLRECGITVLDDGKKTVGNGMAYTTGLNKREWLYYCLANEIKSNNSFIKIYAFIEAAVSPIRYTTQDKREKYHWLKEELNKILLFAGLSVGEDGKLQQTVKASSLDEVDRRVSSLKKKLYDRAIHAEVTKYCISDYLRKDYFDAVFEAAKGLAERVRQLSGLKTDGGELFQTAFSTKDPYIFFNAMITESEKSEFKGLKELLEAIFHLVRNPAAHTPKVNWKVDETKALDILTLISFAHKYLDECNRIPGK